MKLLFIGEARAKGAPVVAELGKSRYEFKPDASGNLVCDVKDEAHVDQLMATKNFRNLDAKPAKKAEQEPGGDGAGKGDGSAGGDKAPKK